MNRSNNTHSLLLLIGPPCMGLPAEFGNLAREQNQHRTEFFKIGLGEFPQSASHPQRAAAGIRII